MRRILQEVNWFLHQKLYMIALSLTALCSYGFAITHYSIGIDDTAVELYLEEGLEVVMGRWTIFLVNKVFHMSEFAPFMLELIGVLIFMLGITLFAVLLRRILGEQTGIMGYTIFACLFLSSPIISEVYIYYYHDGVDLGYVLTALALFSFMEGMEQKGKKSMSIWHFLVSMLLVWAAVGCYESFLVLYILGILVILFLRGMAGKEKLTFFYVAGNLGIGALLTAGCILLRAVMIQLVTVLFGLQDMISMKNQRSLSEMLVLFQGREGMETLIMLIKRFWVVYHVNAFVYLPVTVYEFAVIVLGVMSVYLAVRKRSLWFPVLWAGMIIAPFLLSVAEAKVTLYRSCQFLPFFAALGGLLLYCVSARMKNKIFGCLIAAAAFVLVYNQSTMMNKSFYVDHQKYEHTREVLNQAAIEIKRAYGSDVPVVFTGHYDVPHEFVKDYYVGYGSWQYNMIVRITDPLDEHLKEKYFSPWGYSFIGEAQYPFILWGLDAFDNTNREMIAFLRMHGHDFNTITDPEVLEKARKIGDTLPGWPAEGSVCMQDGYVLVHFE